MSACRVHVVFVCPHCNAFFFSERMFFPYIKEKRVLFFLCLASACHVSACHVSAAMLHIEHDCEDGDKKTIQQIVTLLHMLTC